MPEIFKDHRVAEITGVQETQVLTDPDLLLEKAYSLTRRLKLTVVKEFVHKFEPRGTEESGGLSLLMAISESHLAIHTWEQEKCIHIDVFTCSPYTNMWRFRDEISEEFPSESIIDQKILYTR